MNETQRDDYSRLYEELRAAIDGGSESMTHADALEWVMDAHAAQETVVHPKPDELAALKARIRKFEYLLGHPVAWAVPSELEWLKAHHGPKQIPCIDVYAKEQRRATVPLYGARGWENKLAGPPVKAP